MRAYVFLFLCAAVSLAFAEKQPFERYKTIIDRQMFGPLPPGFDPTKSPNEVQKTSGKDERQLTQEQEKLQSAVHFSVLDVRPDGEVAVGFTDNSDPKAPRNYFLKRGESRGGWTVKEADATAATMTIVKDDIEVSLSLGGNSAKGGGTSRAGAAPVVAANGGGRRAGLLGGETQRAKRQLRRQEAQAAAARQQEEAAARDAARQAQAEEEKQQREAERAEQRQQLLAIQEELKRVREAKAEAAKAEAEGEGGSGADDEAE